MAPKCSSAPGNSLEHRLHVSPDEGVVILAATPGPPTAQVERIAAQGLVVGAGIERHGDHPAGADTAGRGVDRQLSRRYTDAADAPVTGAGDLFAIAAHDDVNVACAQAEGGKGLLDVAGPVDRQVDPVRAAVLRSGRPHPVAGQRISDHGQQLGRVAGQHREIERLVAVVEVLQIELPGAAGRHGPELAVSTFCLLVKRQHRRRQPAGEAQLGAFPYGERDSAVADPVVQDRMGSRRRRLTVSHNVSLFSAGDLVLSSPY